MGALACTLTVIAGAASATADGPDFLRVTGVGQGNILNMRTQPSVDGALVGRIPAGTDGVISFGCVGGVSAEDWQSATEAEREIARETRWCLVGYDRVIGWSAGWFLSEGRGPDTFNGGDKLTDLAGSEWLLRDFAGDPAQAEAWVQFTSDGTAFGDSGCNRFTGSYTATPGGLALGPLAMTKRACPGPQSETETAFMIALGQTQRVAATHLVLSLFDADNRLLATLTRRDVD